jgi:hypothetical protein
MWVFQSETRRFTLIAPNLTLARTLLLPQTDVSKILTFTPYTLLPRDRVLGRALFGDRVNATTADGRVVSTSRQSDSGIVVLGRDGSVERRAASLPPNSAMAVVNNPGQQYQFAPVPFHSPPLVVVSPFGDRLAIVTTSITSGTGGDYQLTLIRSSGDTVYTRKHPYASTPVTRAMADSVMQRMETVYGRGSRIGSEELLATMRARIPAVIGPFNGLEISSDGTVWMRRNTQGQVLSEWLVFNPSGDLMGTVTMPRRGVSLRAVDGPRIWATETDADGFVSIVLFRLVTPMT